MTIAQRASVDGVSWDIERAGLFYDSVEKRAGRWSVPLCPSIYETDRLAPETPGRLAPLDEAVHGFPGGCRHLACAQTGIDYTVKRGMPGLKSLEMQAHYRRGAKWLASATSPT